MNDVNTAARQNAARKAAFEILCALLDAVKESGTRGAPAGPMYAAVMGRMSLESFNSFMGALVTNGNVRLEGHVYYFVKDL